MNKVTKKIIALILAAGVLGGLGVATNLFTTEAATAQPAATVTSGASVTAQSGGVAHTRAMAGVRTASTSRGPRATTTVEPAMTDTTTSGVIDSRLIHRPGQAVAGTDTGQWASWDDFMGWVLNDTAAVWNWYYQQWGVAASSVHYVFPAPGQVVQTGGCGPTNDTTMEYCSGDDTIYFSKALAASLWTGYTGWGGKNIGGDFAVATMLAHEYGHNVQNELYQGGINSLIAAHGVPNVEQEADCFSGSFARIAGYQGVLDTNDVTEGQWTIFAVGDYLYQRADHHGTPAERLTAWRLGYNSTQGPAACSAILNK